MLKFVNNRLTATVIIIWTLAVTMMRALRLPNDFAEAHWLLDYRFGFMKRGLIGSLCNVVLAPLGLSQNSGLIIGLSVVLFFCFLVLLIVLVFRLLNKRSEDHSLVLMLLVFVTSPFIVMNAHLFGYFDGLLYLLCAAAIYFTCRNRPLTGALFSAAALLIHEGYLLFGLPWVFFSALVYCQRAGHRHCLVRHISAQAVPVVVFLAIWAFQTFGVDVPTLRAQLAEYLGSFEFLSTQAVEIARYQTTGFYEFRQYQGDPFLTRVFEPTVLKFILPSLLVLVVGTFAVFRLHRARWILLAFLFATACPLIMHAFAWDTPRISTYTIAGAFIGLVVLYENREAVSTGRWLPAMALPVLLWNCFSRMPLMDFEVERFDDPVRLLLYAPAVVLALILFENRTTDAVTD